MKSLKRVYLFFIILSFMQSFFFVSQGYANDSQNLAAENSRQQVDTPSTSTSTEVVQSPSIPTSPEDGDFISVLIESANNLLEAWQEFYNKITVEKQDSEKQGSEKQASEKQSIAKQDSPSVLSEEEQVFQQMSPLTLLDPKLLDRGQLIQKLRDDFNISIQTDDPSILNKYLLSYLYNYFKWMLPDKRADGSIRLRTPYYLHARSRHSRQMVERDGNNIYFSQNAGHKIITQKFHEIMDAVYENSDGVLPDEIQITFEYDNELYSQLNAALLESKDIKDFVHREFGIVFDLEKEDPDYSFSQEFTHNELILILKQLLDLPVHIRYYLALKKVIRMATGYQPPWSILPVAGAYFYETKMIQLFDPAFMSVEDEQGERIVLHEIGHALWGKSVWHAIPQSAKDEYRDLSWEGEEPSSSEFVSEYSATNIQEDFAEHFAAYLDNPETLAHKTPRKYQWLKENIFVNTEYFSSPALENLKIFVHSELEDLTPPYLEEGMSELTVEGGGLFHSDSEYVHIVNIKGLFDDISGVKDVYLSFSSENAVLSMTNSMGPFRDIYAGATCDKIVNCNLFNSNIPGVYSFTDHIISLSDYPPGTYQLSDMRVEDYSGNDSYIYDTEKYFGKVQIYVPGTKIPEEEEGRGGSNRAFSAQQAQYIKDNMEVVLGSIRGGDTAAAVLLPDILSSNKMTYMSIHLKGRDTERKLEFSVDVEGLDQILSKFETLGFSAPRRPQFFSIPIIVPTFLPSEKYDIVSIEYQTTEDNYFLRCDGQCSGVEHMTNQADLTHPQAIAEDIVLSVLHGSNSEGGDTSIGALVPVTGFEHGEDYRYQYAILRTPKGNRIQVTAEWVESAAGTPHLQFQFDLKPYHEQGEYILSYIELVETHSMVTDQILGWYMYGEDYKTRDRLFRRGIRKTIKIKIPPYQEGPQS